MLHFSFSKKYICLTRSWKSTITTPAKFGGRCSLNRRTNVNIDCWAVQMTCFIRIVHRVAKCVWKRYGVYVWPFKTIIALKLFKNIFTRKFMLVLVSTADDDESVSCPWTQNDEYCPPISAWCLFNFKPQTRLYDEPIVSDPQTRVYMSVFKNRIGRAHYCVIINGVKIYPICRPKVHKLYQSWNTFEVEHYIVCRCSILHLVNIPKHHWLHKVVSLFKL